MTTLKQALQKIGLVFVCLALIFGFTPSTLTLAATTTSTVKKVETAKTSSAVKNDIAIKEIKLAAKDFTQNDDDKFFYSKELKLDFTAQNFVIGFSDDSQYQIRFKIKNKFQDWQVLGRDELARENDKGAVDTQLVFANNATHFQLRSDQKTLGISVKYFNIPQKKTTAKLKTAAINSANYQMAVNENVSSLKIISRSDWLDSSIELDNDYRNELWPSAYQDIKKIVLHHTASSLSDLNGDGKINQKDYQASVRSIYFYHARVNNWGDIGYQYVVDPEGNIYEGRFGGDGVVGGHAYRDKGCTKFGASNLNFNKGTIGISMLGTYSSKDITPAAREALTSLIAKKSWEFSFEPSGSSFFIDQNYPNVIGHRDIDCTECPGNLLYTKLPDIRQQAQVKYMQYNQQVSRTYRSEIVSISPDNLAMKNGESKEITVKLKNTGTMPWRNYTANNVYLASDNIKKQLASLDYFRLAAVDNSATTTTKAVAAYPVSAGEQVIKANLTQPNIMPSQEGTFVLKINSLPNELLTKQKFVMALGNVGWSPSVVPEVTLVNTGLDWAGTLQRDTNSVSMLDEATTPLTLKFLNRGTKEWQKGDVKLLFLNSDNLVSKLKDSSWKASNGSFNFSEASVKPGETATFKISLYGKNYGDYTNNLLLYYKGSTKVSGSDYEKVQVSVKPSYVAEVVDSKIPSAMLNVWRSSASITFKNTGQLPWNGASLMIGDANGVSTSVFKDSTWYSKTTIDKTGKINPGETVTFLFKLKAPTKIGEYKQVLSLQQGSHKMYISTLPNTVGQAKNFEFKTRIDKPKPVVKKK